MTPEEFRARFMASRGLNINDTPIPQVPPVVPPPGPGGTGLPGDTPYRTPTPGAIDKWRTGVSQDMSAGVIPTPSAAVPPPTPAVAAAPPPVPRAFPAEGAEPTPYTPPGVSLTSAPAATPAPGWAGTVGMTSPEEAKAFEKGGDYQKALAGLDEIAKGLKPKAPPVQIPNLLAGAPDPNQGNQMAMQLMAAMMNKRGLTLTGR
jgi:hypothetical protein